MKETKFLRTFFFMLMILLAMDIGSRLVHTTSEAIAGRKVEYKVVEASPALSMNQKEYEKLLNDMASKGWVYDHKPSDYTLVFRK